MTKSLQELLSSIRPVDMSLTASVQTRLDDLTKPRGSLGRLEEIAMKYALATGTCEPVLKRKKVFCFAADHGVAVEGVSAFPAEVTPQMVYNMLGGGAAISVLSRHAGADLEVIDMGVNHDFPEHPLLRSSKIRYGTSNCALGPAMSVDEAIRAVMTGASLAIEARQQGYDLLATGELGIGNTTPATALYAALLGLPVETITGRGTGLDDDGLARKVEVLRRVLETNRASLSTPLETLAAVGGFEIAGICGLILGAASVGMPVVVDGFISSSAAVVAMKLSCKVGDYLFFSHLSNEQGHRAVMQRLGAVPILDLDLRLGEGTGAALAMQVIEASLKIYHEMATFSSARVSGKNS
ncbi:MAG: nicotinate-nucleotide--dimethylbenzimidazole phosphoribosyltransferase [Chlorobiaceae bacterium]|nr:nicotinate-nucleotide--dimethylbenzimidazole phosphoribosyltransferase [Chlorobiaceae bacterium]NTW73789.1 nicotinate-nucleotide--dimethylbenzimidazole phosphoribosyltransferase [Chlorobiaceae bacterium]